MQHVRPRRGLAIVASFAPLADAALPSATAAKSGRARRCGAALFVLTLVLSALSTLLPLTSFSGTLRRRDAWRPAAWAAGFKARCASTHARTLRPAEGTCVGSGREDGQYCIVPRVCVNRARGLFVPSQWVPGQTLIPPNGSGLAMYGLPVDMHVEEFRLPAVDISDNELAEAIHVELPVVVGSIYECGHMSHFLFNGLFPIAAAAARVALIAGNAKQPPLFIASRSLGACSLDLTGALAAVTTTSLDALVSDAPAASPSPSAAVKASLMSLEKPDTLPETTHCFGPAMLGIRRACLHSYCARVLPRGEIRYIADRVKAYFNAQPVRGAPMAVTIIQRRATRVVVNMDEVANAVQSTLTGLSAACRESSAWAARGDARLQWLNDSSALDGLCSSEPPVVFRVVELEDMPFAEQVRTFASTDVLVGMHGNAIGHALWMPPDGAVIEGFMYGWSSSWFETPLREALGLHYTRLDCLSPACLALTPEQAEKERASMAASGSEQPSEGLIKARNVVWDVERTTGEVLASLSAVAAARFGRQVHWREEEPVRCD